MHSINSKQRVITSPLTIEVENVDDYYHKLKEQGVPIAIALHEEPWGDRHFAIIALNGIGIDIVTYSAPE